jgi:hypothetical protein
MSYEPIGRRPLDNDDETILVVPEKEVVNLFNSFIRKFLSHQSIGSALATMSKCNLFRYNLFKREIGFRDTLS